MSTTEEKTPETTETPNLAELGKDLFHIMCAVRGVDPEQVQGMAKFMDADSIDETTYYPNQKTAVAIAQLRIFGQGFYRGHDWNEYDLCADILGTNFKGYKGFKSEQYKDITSGQPNLDKLQGLQEETKRGILSSLLRGKSE